MSEQTALPRAATGPSYTVTPDSSAESHPLQRHVTAAARRLVVLVHSVLWPLALAALTGFRSVPEAQRQVGQRSAPATVSGSAVALSESTTCAMEKSRQSRR